MCICASGFTSSFGRSRYVPGCSRLVWRSHTLSQKRRGSGLPSIYDLCRKNANARLLPVGAKCALFRTAPVALHEHVLTEQLRCLCIPFQIHDYTKQPYDKLTRTEKPSVSPLELRVLLGKPVVSPGRGRQSYRIFNQECTDLEVHCSSGAYVAEWC